jgi:serine/threonine-protein kinase
VVSHADVVLRLLPPEEPLGACLGAVIASRLRIEASIASGLAIRSPHVAAVSDYGCERHRPYLVTELLRGETLELRLVKRGPLPPGEVVEIVDQIAQALDVAHRANLHHGRLDAAKVFLTEDGDGSVLVKVLDFGAEQGGARSGRCGRSDLWSLAAIAYEAMTGRRPVERGLSPSAPSPSCRADLPEADADADLTPSLASVFRRALQLCPRHRYASAPELAQALRDAVAMASIAMLGTPAPTVELPIVIPMRTDPLTRHLRVAGAWLASLFKR